MNFYRFFKSLLIDKTVAGFEIPPVYMNKVFFTYFKGYKGNHINLQIRSRITGNLCL